MKVAVIGLGKIGLPLAVQYARKGHTVVGVDIDPRTVRTVNDGDEPFPGEAQLGEGVAETVAAGTLTATLVHAEAVTGAHVVVLVVPLVVAADGQPDYAAMDSASASVAGALERGTLVVYETTLPVGTTRTRWKPLLEQGSGLVEGSDFHVVFSPERVLTGRVFADLRRYPKLVGALSPEGAEVARAFYEAVLDFDDRPDLPRPNGVWDLGTAEAAELTKLAETTYRDVNIGLANQFALFSEQHGIDVHAVIDAANSQPYSHIHRPGVAVGGHCIPVYPRLYLTNDPGATVVRAAREANTAMPAAVVRRLTALHGDLQGARVLVLGAAYRGGVKETAFSGVFPLVRELMTAGADVVVHDPLYDGEELTVLGLQPYVWGDAVDAAVVQADHAAYADLAAGDLPGVRTLLDGRGVTRPELWAGVVRVVVGDGTAVTPAGRAGPSIPSGG